MAQTFYLPIQRVFDNLGLLGAGFKLNFFLTSTTTPKDTFSDVALTIPNTNPVIADSTGRFTQIFVEDLADYKAVLTDADDNTIWTSDPVDPKVFTLDDFDPRPASFWGTTAGTSTVYTLAANPSIDANSFTHIFLIEFNITCGDDPTLAIDGLSALLIKKYNLDSTLSNLEAGDVLTNTRYWVTNNGSNYVILNPEKPTYESFGSKTATIATGEITYTGSYMILDTEAAAATDDLDTINGGTEGDVLIIRSTDDARNIVVKNGSIKISNGLDATLDLVSDSMVLFFNGTNWTTTSISLASNEANSVISLDTQIVSDAASIIFNQKIDNTFSKYRFEFNGVLPANDAVFINCFFSTDGGSTFKTTNYTSYTINSDVGTNTNHDAHGTTSIPITDDGSQSANRLIDNASDNVVDGHVILNNPASTTKFKSLQADLSYDDNVGNYSNSETRGRYQGDTSAVNAIKFEASAGNITGTIRMYGIK